MKIGWQLLLAASKAGSAMSGQWRAVNLRTWLAMRSSSPRLFSNFYHLFPVLSESDPEKKAFLLWMTEYFGVQLERTLGVLGIEVPEYM